MVQLIAKNSYCMVQLLNDSGSHS